MAGRGQFAPRVNLFERGSGYAGAMPSLYALAALFLAVVNCWTVVCFWDDKRRAVAGERRIPEADLLGLALVGGTPGALLARQLFRHKTRKEPFSTTLWVIVALQVGGLLGLTLT